MLTFRALPLKKESNKDSRLQVLYKNSQIDFPYRPYYYPVRGESRQKIYEEIATNTALRPAEGFEISLGVYAAMRSGVNEWGCINNNFISSSVIVPVRNLWIPRGSMPTDKILSGVLVEKDPTGIGMSTQMEIPDLSSWKSVDDIYVSPDGNAQFVPESAFSSDGNKDGLVRAMLDKEGTDLLAVARSHTRSPRNIYDFSYRLEALSKPKQTLAEINTWTGHCYLNPFSEKDWGRAFAVFKEIVSLV